MVRSWRARILATVATVASALNAGGCARTLPLQGDGYDPSQLPEGLRADYALFARRCSKCHGLARPLGSGIDDDAFWRKYVEQMRLKPGSGISLADEGPILRFLHYYSVEQRRREGKPEAPAPASSAEDKGTR